MRCSRSFGLSLVRLVTFGISWERAFPVWLWKVSMELRFIPRQRIKKQRHYFADRGSYSQSCGFPSSSSSSVTQLCPTLCDPMNCSMPGLPVHHQLPESTQTHVHWVGDHPTIQPTISSSVVPFSSCPRSFPVSGSFWMSQLCASGGQSIGVSASTSVLLMNTQDWSPLGWTGWISLQSKGLSRVFFNSTVQKHQFLCAQLSL